MFDRILNMRWVLNIPQFWIYQIFEYARIAQGSEYVWIISEYPWLRLGMPECVNMPS